MLLLVIVRQLKGSLWPIIVPVLRRLRQLVELGWLFINRFSFPTFNQHFSISLQKSNNHSLPLFNSNFASNKERIEFVVPNCIINSYNSVANNLNHRIGQVLRDVPGFLFIPSRVGKFPFVFLSTPPSCDKLAGD